MATRQETRNPQLITPTLHYSITPVLLSTIQIPKSEIESLLASLQGNVGELSFIYTTIEFHLFDDNVG